MILQSNKLQWKSYETLSIISSRLIRHETLHWFSTLRTEGMQQQSSNNS